MKLIEISKKISVSPATISRVINNSGYVSPETRQRVLEAIEKYAPLKLAPSSKVSTTKRIAVMVPSLSTKSSYPDIVESMFTVFDENGYFMMIYNTRDDSTREQYYLSLLNQHDIDGVCVCASSKSEINLEEALANKLPIVYFDTYPMNVNGENYVVTDFIKAGLMPTNHLIKHGHTRIGLIVGNKQNIWGYERALENADIQVDPNLIAGYDYSIESGYKCMNELIDRNPDMTAVYVSGRRMTYGALKALAERKVAVPGDIALIGHDIDDTDFPFSMGITSIIPNDDHTGRVCAEMLLNLIQNKNSPNKTINTSVLIEPTLLIRESCGCMA